MRTGHAATALAGLGGLLLALGLQAWESRRWRAPFLGAELVLPYWDRYGNWQGDPLARFGFTHVAVMAYIDEIGYYHWRFPDAMGRARPLGEWILWKTRVSLDELPPRDGSR